MLSERRATALCFSHWKTGGGQNGRNDGVNPSGWWKRRGENTHTQLFPFSFSSSSSSSISVFQFSFFLFCLSLSGYFIPPLWLFGVCNSRFSPQPAICSQKSSNMHVLLLLLLAILFPVSCAKNKNGRSEIRNFLFIGCYLVHFSFSKK